MAHRRLIGSVGSIGGRIAVDGGLVMM